MPPKKKKEQRPKGWLASHEQVEALLAQATQALMDKDYSEAIPFCLRVLRYLPMNAPERGEAYAMLGNAYSMLKRFEDSYQMLSKAIQVSPTDSFHWFNRALTDCYTFRSGQALRDIEQAVALEGRGKMAETFAEQLVFIKKIVKDDLALRGKNFSIDQLIEQQELFQDGLKASKKKNWIAAIEAYQGSIAMRDCLPQPHGNMGICLMMLQRYDEAEKALLRALEIDPKYDLARRNLEVLKKARDTGKLPLSGGVHSPFEDVEIKSGITFVKEDDEDD